MMTSHPVCGECEWEIPDATSLDENSDCIAVLDSAAVHGWPEHGTKPDSSHGHEHYSSRSSRNPSAGSESGPAGEGDVYRRPSHRDGTESCWQHSVGAHQRVQPHR